MRSSPPERVAGRAAGHRDGTRGLDPEDPGTLRSEGPGDGQAAVRRARTASASSASITSVVPRSTQASVTLQP